MKEFEKSRKNIHYQEILKLPYFTVFQSFSGGQTEDAVDKEGFKNITLPYSASEYGRRSGRQDGRAFLAG